MPNSVPQFPGKGGTPTSAAGRPQPTQARPGWQNAMCPFLTAGEIARTPDNIVVTAGVQKPLKAQPCQGPQCMLFVALKNADGSETAGCAPTMTLGAMFTMTAQLQMLNGQVFEFIAAAKAGAAAEAATTNAPAALATPPLSDPSVPPASKTE